MIISCSTCNSRYDASGYPAGHRISCRCGDRVVVPAIGSQAKSLHCPGCGGPVGGNDSHCGHCLSPVLLKTCTHCFARLFHEAKHCDRCGGSVQGPGEAVRKGRAQQRKCPRCQHSPGLASRMVNGFLLQECSDCHGLWVDHEPLERLLEERKGGAVAMALGDHAIAPQAANDAEERSGRFYIKCPQCAQVMKRTNFAGRSGIILDICKAHGTWFDRSELSQVIAFVSEGGIERAQKQDALRRSEEASSRRSPQTPSVLSASVPLTNSQSIRLRDDLLPSVVEFLGQFLFR